MRILGVRFRRASKIYSFDAADFECSLGARVVVETERGMTIGEVASAPAECDKLPPHPLKKVLRIAEERDLVREERNRELEEEARRACIELVAEKNLPMKLLTVDCLFDRSKILFHFASEGRVDFRELVRDLAKRFHTRIEMRQVGVRDEAKMVGGVGCCGRELCCATWLSDFAPISVRMAKSQNISLNPSKISGICGRLMCCLAYEHQMYEELSQGMPKVGKRVKTPRGEGKVIRRNALEGTFSVIVEGQEVEMTVEEHRELKAQAAAAPEGTEVKREGAEPKPPREERGRRPRPAPPAEPEAKAPAPEGGEGEARAKSGRPPRRRRRKKKPAQAQPAAQGGGESDG